MESLLDVDSLLGRSLKVRDVSLGLTPRHRALLRNLQHRVVVFILDQRLSYLPLAFLHINLVTEDNKGEVLGIVWARLDEKLVAPAVQRFKGFCTVDVVYEYAAIRASVVGHAERLEALLSSRIPELSASIRENGTARTIKTHLHRHQTIVHHDFLGEARRQSVSCIAKNMSAPTSRLRWWPCIGC